MRWKPRKRSPIKLRCNMRRVGPTFEYTVDNRRFINGVPTMRHLWNLARVSVGYFGFCDGCGREAELNRAHVCLEGDG